MSRKQLREWEFKCNNKDCEVDKIKKYKWSDDEEQEQCPECGEELRLHIEYVNEGPMIMTSKFKNKGRPRAEARARSLNHFKKDVYDTLPMWERKHFAKKHGWSLKR